MLYIVFSFIAIVCSFLAASSRENTSKYIAYLRISFCIVFFLWGFEYYNTVDFAGMLEKFNYVNYGVSTGTMFEEDIEPVVRILFVLCKPLGNLSYYIFTALFEIYVFYKLAIYVIPRKYIWLFFVLLLINFDNVVLIMTLKRQILAVSVSFLAMYLLVKNVSHKYVYALILIFISFNIHRAAFINILLIPFFLLEKRITYKSMLVLFILFVLQYVINFASYSDMLFNLVGSTSEKYAHYANQMNDEITLTPIYIFYNFVLFSMFLFHYNRCNGKETLIVKCSIFYLLINNYLSTDLARLLLLFQLSLMFSIPCIISHIKFFYIRNFVLLFSIAVSLRLFYNAYTDPNKASMTYGFKEFNTILEAPSLQIDNPYQERIKYIKR